MKVIREGHQYEVENFEKKDEKGQIIQFIEKVPNTNDDGSLLTLVDGTTNEELLEVLINRIKYLQGKFPCKENACTITHLEEGLMWLEKRTRDRQKRNVEGKHLK